MKACPDGKAVVGAAKTTNTNTTKEDRAMDEFWKLFRNVSIVVAVVAVAAAAGWTVGREMVETRTETRRSIESLQERVDERLVALEKEAELKTAVDEIPPVPDDSEQARDTNVDIIRIDETQRGRLGRDDATLLDGSYFDEWVLNVDTTVRVTIEMRSADLDSFLFLSRGRPDTDEWELVASDDDGGDGWNSRLESQELTPGAYTIIANTYGQATGSYTVSVFAGRDDGSE